MATYILTEQQVKTMAEIAMVECLCESALGDGDRLQRLLKDVKKYLAGGIAATMLVAAIENLNISKEEKDILIDEIEMADDTTNIFQRKVEAVKQCMEYYAKLNGFTLESVQVSPEVFVSISEKYNYDLPLMLAQAQVESHFGTTPRAMRTGSIFSIGAWDNGSDRVTYSSQNDSIEPYVRIMMRDYLNGKTVDQMLQPGNMVNQLGQRYTSNQNYENDVRLTRNAIIKRNPDLAL